MTPWVAPKRLASSSLWSTRSTATISAAPATRAPWMAAMPTPPQPNTTTDEPGVTLAVLMAAPTPVITPQPTSEAISKGMSSAIFTTPCSGRTIYSANVPVPAKPKRWATPSSMKCGVRMAAICTLEHRLGCLRSMQKAQ